MKSVKHVFEDLFTILTLTNNLFVAEFVEPCYTGWAIWNDISGICENEPLHDNFLWMKMKFVLSLLFLVVYTGKDKKILTLCMLGNFP